MPIARHRTALKRNALSRPIRLALEDQIISAASTVFDYGCGHGGDIAKLQSVVARCAGWDPVHRPDAPQERAEVVNLGYVVNVIEDASERGEVLRRAWSLATRVLVVSARLRAEVAYPLGEPYADGFVTRRATFQKLYEQQELQGWIQETLESTPVAAAPGVFYVFRDEQTREAFLAARYRRPASSPRLPVSQRLFEEHADELAPLLEFLAARGRPPEAGELSNAPAVVAAFGSLKRAMAIVRRVVGPDEWERVAGERSEDLLIYLALARFKRRPPFSALPLDLQSDIRAFFQSYKRACALGDEVLFAAGRMDLVERAFRACTVGKVTPSALYIHISALTSLPALLRVYEGCARSYIGTVESANVIKLHRGQPQVSYLTYPDFDSDPHPRLAQSVVVPLQTFRSEWRNYVDSTNPFILHRKEEFVAPSHPLRRRFELLTKSEVRAGLFEDPSAIGTATGWDAVLARRGYRLRGHRLVRAT